MTDRNTRMQLPGIIRFLIKLIQIVLYIPIQIIFIPFAIIGLVDAIYKEMIKKMGEPWKFGIDMSNDPKAAVESFLKECGLKKKEYTQFSEKIDIEPFYCIVEAEKL